MISIPVRIYVYYKAIQWKMDKPKGIGKRLNNYRKLLISFLFMLFCFFVGIIINIIASKFNL